MPLKPTPATSSEPQMSVGTHWHPRPGAVEWTPAEEDALTKLCDDQEAKNWPLIALHLAQLNAVASVHPLLLQLPQPRSPDEIRHKCRTLSTSDKNVVYIFSALHV